MILLLALLIPALAVRIEGTVRLSEIGLYRVGYRIGDGKPVDLGLGWTGHFEPVAGVSYTVWEEQDGVPTILLHCPWRRGGGTAWVDYHLRLPEGRRAKLVFGCSMWRKPEIQRGSDGVTYAVYLNGREAFKKHIRRFDWEWHEIDLSKFAGKELTLRLEVGPGPRNNPSWDYSLWGDPMIVVEGEAPRPKPPEVLKVTLEGLSNDPSLGVKPSVHYRFSNGAERVGDEFRFIYDGEDCELIYVVRPREGVFPAEVEVRLDDEEPFYAFKPGYVELEGGRVEVKGVEVESFEDGRLRLLYAFGCGDEVKRGEGTFWIEGKTLFFEFRTFEGWASKVEFGGPVAGLRRSIFVPYLFETGVFYLPTQRAFCSVYLDFTRSDASYLRPTASFYLRKTDGTRNPVRDVCLFTVSREFPEVLRNIPWEPSPYFDLIGDRVVFDIWGGHLAEDAEWVRELSSYGISKAIMLKHVWQRYGYDNALPTTVPANPDLGGDEGAKKLSKACRDAGWLFALHENYIDFYPNSHEWNPDEVALNPDGSWRKAWFNRGTGIQSYAYKNWAMAKYARKYSPEIHRRYRTTACFYDVNSCAPPWLHLDCDAREPDAAMFKGRMKGNLELFKVAREAHEGPFFGEGNKHFWWAGLVDGVEAQVVRKEWAPWLVDFDLLKIHPQMVNHGMGYWSRWQDDPKGYWRGMPSPEKMDKYRAMELAFGHAAFIPTELWRCLDWVLKEYYLTRPVQARYTRAKARRILYEVDGQLVPSSVALALGAPLERIFVEYDSGLRLWVNGSEGIWEVEGRKLPQFGFLALADDFEAWTALEPGGEFAVDFCLEGRKGRVETLFANGRGFPPERGKIAEVSPSVELQPMAPRRFRITYRFKVGRRALEEVTSRDLTVFVHFVNFEVSDRDDGIVFQHDHRPKLPTTRWEAGAEVVDGPYEVEVPEGVPDGRYEIRLGLYDRKGRVMIEGLDDGSARYKVGTLVLKGGRISFEPPPSEVEVGVRGRVNFERKPIDFGYLITAGVVILRRAGEGRFELITHPRDAEFEIGLRPGMIDEGFEGGIAIEAFSKDGRSLGRVDLRREREIIWFRTVPDAARYLIAPQRP
ncbi:hypothetical protein DRP77_04660 [Candidatus Poribacteria bacterium]|nr:MAG: hypothetical protein DRP77_04660 [Candidatus Poribacteria bacterium]